jgi:biopolymer transport protein ExbD
MAVQLQHDDDSLVDMHDINVTPFIDVMLVLLIIFMVAAPLATVNVPLNLPVSTSQPQPPEPDPLFVSVQADLKLFIGDAPVTREALPAQLATLTHGDKEARVFVRADKAVSYGDFMAVMNLLRDAGYLKVALVGAEAAPAN